MDTLLRNGLLTPRDFQVNHPILQNQRGLIMKNMDFESKLPDASLS